jgi:molecular chaperone DnaJ
MKKIFRSFSNNPYKVLGIPPNSSRDIAKKAYFKLAKEYHPDLNSGNNVK